VRDGFDSHLRHHRTTVEPIHGSISASGFLAETIGGLAPPPGAGARRDGRLSLTSTVASVTVLASNATV